MGWSHTYVYWMKIGRDILAVEVPPKEQVVSTLHQAPKLRVPVLRRKVPITSGYKKTSGN